MNAISYRLACARDAVRGRRDRVLCRLFGLHSASCRGRRDHILDDGSVLS